MKEETKPWLAPTCYMCQQALEVLLKAAIIELAGKRHPKIHDLDKLYLEAGLPDREKHREFLAKASAHYFRVRYPDFVRYKYNRQVAMETLDKTKELYQWIRTKITKK
jgi:HEPN domain-containing protein